MPREGPQLLIVGAFGHTGSFRGSILGTPAPHCWSAMSQRLMFNVAALERLMCRSVCRILWLHIGHTGAALLECNVAAFFIVVDIAQDHADQRNQQTTRLSRIDVQCSSFARRCCLFCFLFYCVEHNSSQRCHHHFVARLTSVCPGFPHRVQDAKFSGRIVLRAFQRMCYRVSIRVAQSL